MERTDFVFDETGLYSRNTSETRKALQTQLGNAYGAGETCIFPSGMSAITFLFFLESMKGRTTVLLSDELYCDTPRAAQSFKNLKVVRFDARDNERFRQLFDQHRPTLVFVESFANPTGTPMHPGIAAYTGQKKCTLVVDNTFASSVLFNPFTDLPAAPKYVVESLSKYVSAGTRIGGAVYGSRNAMKEVARWSKTFGLHVPDDHLLQIRQEHQTIQERVKAAQALAEKVYDFISNEFHMLTPRDALRVPVLCFEIETQKTKGEILKIKTSIPWRTSFGGPESKICNWFRVRDGWAEFRLSLGYNDTPKKVRVGLLELKKQL